MTHKGKQKEEDADPRRGIQAIGGRRHSMILEAQALRTRQPPTGVFGPFGPEVPLGVSERVSPKIGVCPKVSGEVPLGPF